MTRDEVARRARSIRLLTVDVDGVLTDGRLYYGDDGSEMKAFNSQDGIGLKMLAGAGVAVAWITGSRAPSVAHRAQALGVVRLVQGAEDKLGPWESLRRELGLAPDACAHIGDDLPDLPVLASVGLAACPADADAEVRAASHFIARARGGHGAVREVVELVLRHQGLWSGLLASYRVPA